MYTALYRTYRPGVFSEILGQEHIVRILRNQISTNSAGHAYLFCGTRGTGKTTIARILAKGLNCTSEGERPCGACQNCKAIGGGAFIDVIEIDAASHNGVDNIRELRESVKYPPAVGRKKVYIIDEVHMLSAGAFNALLKTLEEPPENVVFILATTESQKLPATILSRCMRLDFRRVPESLLKSGMEKICADIGVKVSDSALKLIAANADGSVRDGLSILDQCLAMGEKSISREDVLELLGSSGEEVFAEMTGHVASGKTDAALLLLDKAVSEGKDVRQFMKDWLAHYRCLLIAKFIANPEDILNMSSENTDRIKAQSDGLTIAEINRCIMEISKMAAEAKWSTQPRILLELCIVNLTAEGESEPEEEAKPRPRAKVQAKKAAQPPATIGEGAQAGGTAEAEQGEKEDKQAEQPGQSEEIPAKGETAKEQDVSGLWESLFHGEGCLKGSLNVVRNGIEIKSLSDTECFIVAPSEIAKELIEKNRATIEELLAQRSGAKRTLKCIEEKAREIKPNEKQVEDLAGELSNKLGIHIEIEE